MAGRINDEDLALVRDRSRIDDIVGSFVTLRPGGAGQLKGLCPFHDEKTPSFNVTPSKGFFYCFGCGQGGDVIDFVREINNMSFAEAVEWLADRCGVQLRYEDGPGAGPRTEPGLRKQILDANRAAADFFAGQLASPDALVARQFLDGRGFDRDAAELFGCGFAPTSGKALREHMLKQGFTRDVLVKAGLIRESGWDFFQGRLVWPIRDAHATTLGFGARRLFDDDRMPAKYLNTPETPVYKKSEVLYGLDLARKNIGKKNQAVVVEGYTDVMACHIAGIDTAVASCGTAFGHEHSRMIARLMTADALSGEVVFTFDGDAAGQAAALKVFKEDTTFVAQTYVAVEPTGLDPCDLRLASGDAAVRELVGRRVPLYRFVMRNIVGRYDLDRVEGRLGAVREAAPLVSSVRDAALVSGYVRELAGMVGMDDNEVRAEVARSAKRRMDAPAVRSGATTPSRQPGPGQHRNPATGQHLGAGQHRDNAGEWGAALPEQPLHDADQPTLAEPAMLTLPDPRDRRLEVERGALKLMIQEPHCFDDCWNFLTTDDFTHPAYAHLFAVASELEDRGPGWQQRIADALDDALGEQLLAGLAVEPLLQTPTPRYAAEYSARLRYLTVSRDVTALKAKLQRTNPVEDTTAYNKMFARMIELEQLRRQLQAEALGEA